MNQIEKTFKLELSYYLGDTTQKRFLAFLEDISHYADFYWDIPKMQYDLVKSDKEWKEFLSHPERRPYQLKVEEWRQLPIEKLYEKVLSVVGCTLDLIRKSKITSEKSSLKKALAPVIRCILHSRYTIEVMRTTDAYRGISEQMRADADMHITAVHQANFDFATSVAALKLEMSVSDVRAKLLDICGGDIARIGEFLMTCQYDDEIKKIYLAYRDVIIADNTLENYSTLLAYKIWRELYNVGVDLDTFLDLIGYPSSKAVKNQLTSFLKNPEMHREVISHLKAERPDSYKTYKKQRWVDMLDISQEEARVLNFPKMLRSTKDTEKMIQESLSTISEYFPLSQKESPRQLLFAPIHPFANKRAYQSHTYNSEEKPINIVVMTPTVDSPEDFLRTLAHETTHAIHSIILKLGAEFNILTKQQSDQVPTGVLEDFSQLVEGQFQQKEKTTTRRHKGKLFTSFNQAQGSRWQAPYGLVQIEVREQFEKWIKDGIPTLSIDMISELRYKYDKKIAEWWETGLNFRRTGMSALGWLSAVSPDDGLVYMKRFIVPAKKSKNEKKEHAGLSMSDAFTKRFGDKWIKEQDARILLYWLLLETGRNHETDKYGALIMKKDIRECLEELQKISIDASEFKKIP